MTFYVYGLCEPSTGDIRYVGKTSDMNRRLHSHLSESASIHVRDWVAGLERLPVVAELGSFATESEALEFETAKIYELRPTKLLLNRVKRGAVTGRHNLVFSGLGERVKRLRLERDMSHRDLVLASGVSQANISRIETGRRQNVSVEIAYLIARSLGTTVEYLLTGEAPNV